MKPHNRKGRFAKRAIAFRVWLLPFALSGFLFFVSCVSSPSQRTSDWTKTAISVNITNESFSAACKRISDIINASLARRADDRHFEILVPEEDYIQDSRITIVFTNAAPEKVFYAMAQVSGLVGVATKDRYVFKKKRHLGFE